MLGYIHTNTHTHTHTHIQHTQERERERERKKEKVLVMCTHVDLPPSLATTDVMEGTLPPGMGGSGSATVAEVPCGTVMLRRYLQVG